jgi:predicted ribosome quality control (RQC) complex YloA/Tae2 family protein
MDTFSLQFLTKELNQSLLGKRINQLVQYSRYNFLFKFREKLSPLFLSLDSQNPIMFLSDFHYSNKTHVTPFSTLLSKYLIDSQISDFKNIPLERIVSITFNRRNITGTTEIFYLFIELIPKAANAVFTDESKKILSSFSFPPQHGRSYTQGEHYLLPKQQNKYNPFKISKEDFNALVLLNSEKDEERANVLVNRLSGFSPIMANEIFHLAKKRKIELWEAYSHIIEQLSNNEITPTIYAPKDIFSGQDFNFGENQLLLSPIPLQSKEDSYLRTFSSFNQALQEYYILFNTLQSFVSKKKQLAALLKNKIKHLKKLNLKLQKELDESEKNEQFKRIGELLLSNLKNIPMGKEKVEIINYFDPEQNRVEVTLNPNISPQENAQKYFNKYSKAKKAGPIIKKRIKRLEKTLDYLRKIKTNLLTAANQSQLSLVQKSMASLDIKIQQSPKSKISRKKDDITKYRQFISSDNLQIFVGKDGATNEYVTFKLASDNDFWFHAAGYSGSHVVVRNPSKMSKLPEKSLIEAAQIAAYYSKARNAGRALVHYTQRKFVRKVKGKEVGKVILKSYRTISIQPSVPNSVKQQ